MPLRALSRWSLLFGLSGVAHAQGLPPLHIDPGLVGKAAPAKTEVVTLPAARRVESPPAEPRPAEPQPVAGAELPPQEQPRADVAEPPQVQERPVLPPLFSAHAAAGEIPARNLKPATALTPAKRDSDEALPIFVSADRMHGRTDYEMVAEGAAELRKSGTVLNADKLSYWHLDDEVEAQGNVRLERDRDLFTGPKLRMKVEENTGVFEQPTYAVTRTRNLTPANPLLVGSIETPATQTVTGRGDAERLEFKGEGLFHLNKATYSTCAPGNRDWYAEVDDLDLDYNRDEAEGRDGRVVFKGTPILYSPWLSFSLNNERKSGLLTPTFGTTNTSGMEIMLPWYWNIAPNMDATIAPRNMMKRGLQWNTDFRYLDHKYGGEAHVEYLPDDRIEHKSRTAYSIQHRHTDLGYGFSGNLNLNGVSDDTYFRDLSKPAATLAQNNLLRQGTLTYGATWWSAALTAQRYQVLQDPSQPVVAELYRKLPQFTLTANRYDLPLGGALNFAGEYVKFGHPTSVVGERTIVYPQLSLPTQLTPYLQVSPKLGVHATHYALERQAAGTPDGITRQMPIFSVDSTLALEREAALFGRNLTQTLEPRLNYLYVPKRDQNLIPVFDTGLADFNFASIFAENRYSGGDRIADANQLTATVTSRLIDPATGAELIRGLIGQQYYFTTQHVTLPAIGAAPAETPRSSRTADLLAAVSGQVMPKAYIDAALQFNPRDNLTERFNLGGRYQPEIGKVLNAGYRYTRDLLGQVDFSGQWPLAGGWHGIGRYNYSTKEKRMIESVAGLEYDGGCWVVRIVAQSIATQTQRQTTSLFLQLELNGFSSLGSNPLNILRRNIPGYGVINRQPTDALLTPY